MSQGFMGNERIKPAGSRSNYTPEQAIEVAKCMEDCIYFIENYIKIINLDGGLIPFKVYPYQKRVAETIIDNRFTILKFPRQSGKSTIVSAIIAWFVIFSEHPQNVLIAAHKAAAAMEIMRKVKTAIESLPSWMQQGIVKWNEFGIELENGSRVSSTATTKEAGRSGSYNLVMLDEFAFVQKNIADEFYNAIYPTISSSKTSKLVMVSTPNGMNLFYETWENATAGKNEYKPLEIKWDDVPGRDDEFKRKTISNVGKERWSQEFECSFLGGALSLIPSDVLRRLKFREPIKELPGDTQAVVKMFTEPDPEATYMISVDTARGKGIDYSAFTVIDVSKTPYEVVATYYDDNIAPMLYPNVIFNTARIYNNAYVLVETNDLGQQVIDILHGTLEYENVLGCEVRGRSGQILTGMSMRLGVTTSVRTKSIGCQALKNICENNQLIVNDFKIIEEMSNFNRIGNTYKAEEGNHDDLVMCLVLFAWATTQPYFLDLTNQNIRQIMYAKRIQQMEEDLVPFGFIDYGDEDEAPRVIDTSDF